MTASIEDRVAALERKRHHGKVPDESMRRARLSVEEKGAYSAVWKWVPGTSPRAEVLSPVSLAHPLPLARRLLYPDAGATGCMLGSFLCAVSLQKFAHGKPQGGCWC